MSCAAAPDRTAGDTTAARSPSFVDRCVPDQKPPVVRSSERTPSAVVGFDQQLILVPAVLPRLKRLIRTNLERRHDPLEARVPRVLDDGAVLEERAIATWLVWVSLTFD